LAWNINLFVENCLRRCEMLAFCPNCWNAVSASPATCRNCGTRLDVYSHDYENQLVSLLSHSHAEKRVEICLVLGQREKRTAVPHLVRLLADPSMLVRVAALRALGEIGDSSAIPDLMKAAADKTSPIRAIAQQVIDTLKAHGSKHRVSA
jgi:hypothetical protein